jgi:aldehyde dehydrogenase (NAD+)
MHQLDLHRQYFATGITKPYDFRIAQLKKLKAALLQHEDAIYDALYSDLRKNKEECWVTEIGMTIAEINHAIKHLSNWMNREPVSTNLSNLPSRSYIIHEPLGVVLIISPWNYPLQLTMIPLVGAIAAGNCVAIKASEYAAATDSIMQKIITTTYDDNYISYHTGDGAAVVSALMNSFTFDHIFFTGSTEVGRIIYKNAADKLTPVTLELGGKSPCIVSANAKLSIAAKRIVLTKFSNCGQMCVAPDYVLVHHSVKAELINQIIYYIKKFHGEDASQSYQYGKIINSRHFHRLTNYLQDGKIVYGGANNAEQLYIQPTLVTDVNMQHRIMQEEIFGPILPILTYTTNDEAKRIIAQNKNPLSFYLFTNSSAEEQWWMDNIAFGGGCINNASWHLTNHYLPFGGRGSSGTGAYHGKKSFQIFSHQKSIMRTPTWIDPAIRYPPFKGKLGIFKWLIR